MKKLYQQNKTLFWLICTLVFTVLFVWLNCFVYRFMEDETNFQVSAISIGALWSFGKTIYWGNK